MRGLALLVLCACPQKELEPNDPIGDDDDDDDQTEETGTPPTGPEYLEITHLVIEGEFGWDASRQQLVEVTAGGQVMANAMYLALGVEAWANSGWDWADSDKYCLIMMPLTSSAQAVWAVQDPTVWFGVDYTEGAAGALTDCNTEGKLLDPAVFGEDPVATLVEGYGTWGVGLGEWGPSWYDTFLQAYPDDDLLERYVGARVQSTGDFDPDDFRAFPVQIDPETYEAQDDGTVYLGVPPEQVVLGDTVTTAWYRLSSLWVYGI